MIFQLLIMFFPWGIRRRLLQWKYGYKIDATAWIGKSIILARKLEMSPYSRIHDFVFCKKIDRLSMEEDSGIASLTYITGFPTLGCHHFLHIKDRKCELILGRSAGITSRHYVDCNGGVYIGDFSTIAGVRSQILTHSIDVYTNRQDARPVRVGRYCFVGTCCVILPGTRIPDYSILGGGSVLTKQYTEKGCLYGGVPARQLKRLQIEEIPYFHREQHSVD